MVSMTTGGIAGRVLVVMAAMHSRASIATGRCVEDNGGWGRRKNWSVEGGSRGTERTGGDGLGSDKLLG